MVKFEIHNNLETLSIVIEHLMSALALIHSYETAYMDRVCKINSNVDLSVYTVVRLIFLCKNRFHSLISV